MLSIFAIFFLLSAALKNISGVKHADLIDSLYLVESDLDPNVCKGAMTPNICSRLFLFFTIFLLDILMKMKRCKMCHLQLPSRHMMSKLRHINVDVMSLCRINIGTLF